MNLPALGIDVAKLKFDACLSRPDSKLRHKSFPNSPAGFAQLAAWLARHGAAQVQACLEATGTYSEALALHLHGAGHRVSILNPAVIKAYAESRLTRTKTDKVDAGRDRPLRPLRAPAPVVPAPARSPRVAGTCPPALGPRGDAPDGAQPPRRRSRRRRRP